MLDRFWRPSALAITQRSCKQDRQSRWLNCHDIQLSSRQHVIYLLPPSVRDSPISHATLYNFSSFVLKSVVVKAMHKSSQSTQRRGMLPRIVLKCCLTSIYTKSIYSHLHLLSCSKLQVNSVGGRLEQRWVPGFLEKPGWRGTGRCCTNLHSWTHVAAQWEFRRSSLENF